MAERLRAWRVVAKPSAIDQISGQVLRFAADDALVITEGGIEIDDPDAIVVRDSGWMYISLPEERVLEMTSTHSSWQPPSERPGFAQGVLAGLPAKVYLDGADSKVIVPAPFAHELEERLPP